jgi:hypothetical protein
MSHAKKIIESVLSNKPYSVKTAVNEAMAERIGLILEQELERLGAGLLTEKKKEKEEKEEKEENTDPVGKEDGDIDNDGDKDDSDGYLAKRRAAISAAIKAKKKK